MLKELVRERLIAAADEIFGLFERTIASYEEQLCRAREETERHRRQLEDVYKSHMVLHREDVLQRNSCAEVLPPHPQGASSNLEHSHLPHIKKEEEEADVSKLPLISVCVKSDKDEDKPPECSQLQHLIPGGDHCGGPPPPHFLSPLSYSDNTEDFSVGLEPEEASLLAPEQV
ncbi:uncharacterized protein LOC133400288 isoform X2 [Phycodurus eques]|uniref:uncharacterized protein LOC133400288 isoform X2 n=1 Tax=Phycodurus eques TaxID=693459 RepID=UPI002ACF07A3|nr:uncharacterized protein LOC133400288 isoform X2 [Phycodurus eques]